VAGLGMLGGVLLFSFGYRLPDCVPRPD
jgi:hypothetical protein